MKTFIPEHILKLLIGVLAIFFCFISSAGAHHPGHTSSGSGTRAVLFQGTTAKPNSRFLSTYEATIFDNGVGELHSWTLGGEWGIFPQLSLLLNIPLSYLAHAYRPSESGIGDISFGAKLLFWEQSQFFAFFSSVWGMPTGSETAGLGRGSVTQQADIFVGWQLGEVTLFLIPGINVAYRSQVQPVATIAAGGSTPKLWERIYLSTALTTQIFLDSDTFTSGSWKLYLDPQINFVLGDKDEFTVSIAGRVSIVDELTKKAGATIESTDNALLNDVQWGLGAGLTYAF